MTTTLIKLNLVNELYKCSFINKCFSSRKNADSIRNKSEYIRNVTENHINIVNRISYFKAIFENHFKGISINAFKGVFIFSSRNLFKGFSRRHTDENAQKVFISNLRKVYKYSRLVSSIREVEGQTPNHLNQKANILFV